MTIEQSYNLLFKSTYITTQPSNEVNHFTTLHHKHIPQTFTLLTCDKVAFRCET